MVLSFEGIGVVREQDSKNWERSTKYSVKGADILAKDEVSQFLKTTQNEPKTEEENQQLSNWNMELLGMLTAGCLLCMPKTRAHKSPGHSNWKLASPWFFLPLSVTTKLSYLAKQYFLFFEVLKFSFSLSCSLIMF